MPIDFSSIEKIYVIGIKGSGVVAIVEILKSFGIEISGSDTEEKFFSDEILARLGVEVTEGFSASNVARDADLVIYSTAYSEKNNPEMAEAKRLNLPMAGFPEILSDLFNQKFGIAVCGTHGKTTTTSMLANAMLAAGADPMAFVGSKVIDWNGSALSGQGEYFIAEADEYQNKLSLYDPKAVVFTSCDWDHPDYFETFKEYRKVFRKFIERIPSEGFLVVWGDSVDTLEIAESSHAKVLTYGFSDDCHYRIVTYDSSEFEIEFGGKTLGKFRTKLAGRHNALNATAVIAVCHRLKLDLAKVKKSIADFSGTSRRFEIIGERNGALLVDDYAHHPEEIKATISGARERYPKKNIWVVFHPHTFTRTKALLPEFSQSFSDADNVIVLDIYGSAREIEGGVHSQDLVKQINKYDYEKAEYLATIPEVVEFLKDKLSDNDIVIAMGAGNVWEVAKGLAEEKRHDS
jgi:UDP-N-acetylmuramate--alanine ligase